MSIQRDIQDINKKVEYHYKLSRIKPKRVKFVGEKKLKCPFRGNDYYAVIFCGIDGRDPLHYGICNGTIDATGFSIQVERAIREGWLKPRDTLVLSETKIHTGGENTVLEDWLWESFRIYTLYLPPRTPRWSPVNAVWKHVTRDLKDIRLNPCQNHSIVYATQHLLDSFTHHQMNSFYYDCFSECGCL